MNACHTADWSKPRYSLLRSPALQRSLGLFVKDVVIRVLASDKQCPILPENLVFVRIPFAKESWLQQWKGAVGSTGSTNRSGLGHHRLGVVEADLDQLNGVPGQDSGLSVPVNDRKVRHGIEKSGVPSFEHPLDD